MTMVQFSLLDKLLVQLQTTVLMPAPTTSRPSPADGFDECELVPSVKRHTAALMRINHCGEVCAQALYQGQALVARDPSNHAHLLHAAEEERDHLRWCKQRLDELGAAPSLLTPFFYCQSFVLGTGVATLGDKISLGFIAETERQVATHLADHITQLDPADNKTHAVLTTMQDDEARHGRDALARGGSAFPNWAQTGMTLLAHCMKALTYRL